MAALVALVLLGGLVAYRVLIQPAELKKAQANVVVADEQGKADGRIVGETMDRVREREVYRETVRTVVTEAKGQVDASWNGETVGQGVDAAGAAALCRLHDSLCRPARAEGLSPVRGAVPRAD